MSDKTASSGAEATTEEDPFAGFESSGYENGEEVRSTPAGPDEEPRASVEDDDGGDGDDSSDDSSDDDSSRPKGKQSAQERINELTRLRREAERDAEAVRAQLEELKQRIPPEDTQPPPTAPLKKAEAKDDKGAKDAPPSPDDFDYGELDPRYIQALSRFEVRQEYKAIREEEDARRAQEAAQREQAAVQERFQEQIDRGSKKHDDFYEKVIIGAEKGEWPLSDHLGKLLVESEAGDDIAYHLASHPEEAAQVYRQTPLEQARYFGRMEAKFTADQSAATGDEAGKTVPRTPKTPPPIKPARGTDGKFSPSASTKDFAAFEAHANNQ